MYVIDTQTGAARRFEPIYRSRGENERRIESALQRTALWTLSGSVLRLERFDGTVVAEWLDVDPAEPSISNDGRTVLLSSKDKWSVWRDGKPLGQPFVSRGNASLSPSGRWVNSFAQVSPTTYTISLRDLEIGTDAVVWTGPWWQCGNAIAADWTSDERLTCMDLNRERVAGAPFPLSAYDPSAKTLTPYNAPSVDPNGLKEFRGGTDSCTGLLVRHQTIVTGPTCVAAQSDGAWAPDGNRLVYLRDHRLMVQDIASSTPPVVVGPEFGSARRLEFGGPNVQWDASGRYVVFAAEQRPRG